MTCGTRPVWGLLLKSIDNAMRQTYFGRLKPR